MSEDLVRSAGIIAKILKQKSVEYPENKRMEKQVGGYLSPET